MMEIYLKKPYNQGKDIKALALKIKETELHELVTEISLDMAGQCVEVTLNKDKIKAVGLIPSKVIQILSKAFKVHHKKDSDLLTIKPTGGDGERLDMQVVARTYRYRAGE